MNKEQRIQQLQEAADRKLEYLETLESRGVLKNNKQARLNYEKTKAELEDIVNELGNLTKQERGMDNMEKIEKRSTSDIEFGQMLKGEVRYLTTTADGGAIIPESVEGTIIKKMEEISPAFANTRKFGSVAGTLKIAKETANSMAGFVGEGADVLEGQISLVDVKLTQKRVGAALSLSNQFIHDSEADVTSYAKDLLSRRMVRAIEHSIFRGATADEFAGIKGQAGITVVDLSLATGVTIDELASAHLSIHPEFLGNSAYYMSRPFFNNVAKLKDANGHFYMQMGVVNGKFQYTIQGFPVHVTEALDAGTVIGQAPVVFGSLQEGYGVMIKKNMALTEITQDTTQALRGSKLLVLDGYMDGAVINEQALVKLVIKA